MKWLVLAALLAPSLADACPCYSVTATPNTYNCGVEAALGTNPARPDGWVPIFDLVSRGPAAWGSAGPTVSNIPAGCTATPTLMQAATFPCELLKAIAMNESSWTQFCVPTEPPNKVGSPSQTIIAVDCGYGVGQVTSGMHIGETPSFDRAKVASDPVYNLATGAQILAGKWRGSKCVGDRQPRVIEDWYTATWAYNGLSYSNNPNNPMYNAMRPVCDPNVGCPGRPYQERVFGWIEHPYKTYWTSVPLAYPNRGDITDMPGVVQMVPPLPEPSCAGPTDCVNHRAVHQTACGAAPAPDGGTVAVDGGAPPDLAAADLAATVGDSDAAPTSTPAVDAARPHGKPIDDGCNCGVGGGHRGGLPHFAIALLLAALLARRASHRR
jgi:hypothetical protein